VILSVNSKKYDSQKHKKNGVKREFPGGGEVSKNRVVGTSPHAMFLTLELKI